MPALPRKSWPVCAVFWAEWGEGLAAEQNPRRATTRHSSRRRARGPMRRCCSQCCCAHCNRRYTARTILGISAWRHLPASAPSAKTSVWQSLGLHCSANERRADEATRDVEAWLKCQFMLDKRGEIYEGAVSGVTAFGLFVTLEPLFVEGLVHISTLGPEYLEYDAIKNELRARTGARYGLSDRVRVQVSRVDPDARKID